MQVKWRARLLAWGLHGLTGWYKQMAGGRRPGTHPPRGEAGGRVRELTAPLSDFKLLGVVPNPVHALL